MAWETRYDPSNDIVEVIYTGCLTGSDLQEAASSRIALARETNSTKILVDVSGIKEVQAGMMDVFNLPDELYEVRDACRQSEMALVMPTFQPGIDMAQFYETACKNRGWSVKTFKERQSAIDWLKET